MNDIERLLLKLVAVKEIIIVGIQSNHAGDFRRPFAALMRHPDLWPEGKAVGTEIDQFVIHVVTGRQLHSQTGTDQGLNLCGGSVSCVLLALKWWCAVEIDCKAQYRIAPTTPPDRCGCAINQSGPATLLVALQKADPRRHIQQ